uniref:Peptidase S1 domain-containing protein n=1 Tax=Seriola lalandi dorsalis TaxID=1841481 RepID=A0A3B4Y8W5_SERLL
TQGSTHASLLDNDIALLRLSSTVDFTNFIRPVCLAAAGSVFRAGTTCWVTGWGTISRSEFCREPLQEVDVPVVSNSQCRKAYERANVKITSNMICAGLPEGGKDSCKVSQSYHLIHHKRLNHG